jgi:hypothetical protein
MKLLRFAALIAILIPLFSLCIRSGSAAAGGGEHALDGDALMPPARPRTSVFSDRYSPTLYQPSAYMAGRVAVQALFIESDGSYEASTANWSPAQVNAVRDQIAAALAWWRARLPNARLTFDLTVKVVASGYEPIGHTLGQEGQWIGDTLTRLGVPGANYFEQSYQSADNLRQERGTDWATTIFVANSNGVPGGRFADNLFAYAYVSGPFMVITSDAGPYGLSQMSTVVAHELGHIFGALDQYASAGTPCTQRSGYLSFPTTNSQASNCGTHDPSIMLEPITAYVSNLVDTSALGQLGYQDNDGDTVPDPLDTIPALQIQLAQPPAGQRPVVSGSVADQPFPSPAGDPVTINGIARLEYRINGGSWFTLPAADGRFDETAEEINATLPLYDGSYSIQLRAANTSGGVSQVLTKDVVVAGVGTAPAYTVAVPEMTSSDTIAVSLGAPAGTSVQLSRDPLFGGARWLPVEPTLPIGLADGDGSHTIYVRFRDPSGMDSVPFACDVLLDSQPPTGRAIRHDESSPWLEIQAQDNGSGLAAFQLLNGSGIAEAWQPFQSNVPLPSPDDEVNVRLRDGAGNVSAPLAISSAGLMFLPIVTR